MPWILETNDDVMMWRPESTPPGCVIAMTTRRGGVSLAPYDQLNLGRSTADAADAVTENRRRVLAALGVGPDHLATAGQVHGTRVSEATAPGLHPRTDALLTRTAGLAIAVSGADCLPLLYSSGDVIAAAHSGWRGTADGMPAAALRAALETSASPIEHARVYLGPCIGPCCYVVGEDVAQRFPAAVVTRRGTGVFVDLAAAARLQLERAGVAAANILDPPACTACERELCFSHRRDRGLTGRQWGIAVRLEPTTRR